MGTEITAEQAAKLAKATYMQFLEEPERSKQVQNIPKLVKKTKSKMYRNRLVNSCNIEFN